MEKDALGAHVRDELGISEVRLPVRPVQAVPPRLSHSRAALPLLVASAPSEHLSRFVGGISC